MIPKECKRLAEVDFPIAEVSKHSAREKSIRHGHPSTLHLWWARRPLAACRAVLLGLLLPDPCDEHCPNDFKKKARKILDRAMVSWKQPGKTDEDLRASLLSFTAEFSDWGVASDSVFLDVGRSLVKAAHPENAPLVVDPFAGGGSIPLEALRLGSEAFASDLNPVACLILKVMLEDIPRRGPELAGELRRGGMEIKEKAKKDLAELYPEDPDGATPIVYLWARVVKCESPNCGAEIPLMRTFWLCRKTNRKRALKHKVIQPKGKPPHVEFDVFEPKNDKDVLGGTITKAKATCLACNMVLPPERIRAQLFEQSGGADVVFDKKGNRTSGALMTAVVTLRSGESGRHYRLSTPRDYQAVWNAQKRLKVKLDEWERGGKQGLCPVPDESIPTTSGGFMAPPTYGMVRWGNLFTARQKVALVKLGRLTSASDAGKQPLALVLDRVVNAGCSLCRWDVTRESHQAVYSRQALSMVWDYSEGNPLSESTGGYASALNWVVKVIEAWPSSATGQVQSADATDHPLPSQAADVWFTDPPYYFAVPYADISDFFFVWLKRTLPGHQLLRDSFDLRNDLTPKGPELCEMAHWDAVRYPEKNQQFFEDGMARAFAEGRRVLREDGIGSVVFAHKTTEGWEALLSGMIRGGWTITGSWPIATEMATRLRARDSAALATSVHLVCRPRPEDAPVGDWNEVLHGNKQKKLEGLSERVRDWMERLQCEGIRGADLVFACIGPALEIFSRYSRVETADGDEVKLPAYLEKVWEVVGRTALEQVLGTAEAKARNGVAGAVEEDARLTALFLWTLQSTEVSPHPGPLPEGEGDEEDEEKVSRGKSKGFSLVFDVVRRFAQPLGIDLPKWEGRIIKTNKGVVRLLAVSERAKQLFGEDGADAVADWIVQDPSKNLQGVLFPELEEERVPKVRGRGRRRKAVVDPSAVDLQGEQEATTLDRIHAAMLLQAGGQANALRQLIKAEQDRGPDFLRLANALSALYPSGSEEKRLLDAMLLAVPR